MITKQTLFKCFIRWWIKYECMPKYKGTLGDLATVSLREAISSIVKGGTLGKMINLESDFQS